MNEMHARFPVPGDLCFFEKKIAGYELCRTISISGSIGENYRRETEIDTNIYRACLIIASQEYTVSNNQWVIRLRTIDFRIMRQPHTELKFLLPTKKKTRLPEDKRVFLQLQLRG